MRFRQIHLDFHTSGAIPGVGSAFDPETFARTMQAARVNSVNLFAKCHHGWSYHPTEVGEMHPNLSFDLLGAQVEALQSVGIKTPIYLTAAWDELSADRHPEWLIINPETGEPHHNGTGGRQGWRFLDLGSGYRDYFYAQVAEVIRLFPNADGLWIDICHQMLSSSDHARAAMAAEGRDWQSHADRLDHAEEAALAHMEGIADMAREAGMPVFFNFGHLRRGRADVLRRYFSHLEIESLPTAEWGYDHYPVSARYIEGLGLDFLGMTGKFHHLWGEMGGYKKPEALVYECGAMLAHGARICIGDHLHPTGRIDPSTYSAVGRAYDWVEAREPWCEGTRNLAEIGLLSCEANRRPRYAGPSPHHNTVDDGAVRVLLEKKFTFDVLDEQSDFAPYRLLILPDAIEIHPALKDKIDAYLAGGGRLMLTGTSGLSDDGLLYPAGTVHRGGSDFSGGDFILPVPELQADFVSEPLFVYGLSQRLALDGGTSLGEVFDPYLDRRGPTFSGHLHAPNRPEPNGFVLGAQEGNVLRLAHPVFTCYHTAGSVALLDIIGKAIGRALGAPPMVRTDLPTAGRATLRQKDDARILHLLYATPALRGTLRGDNVQPIQDIVPLRDVRVEVEAPGLRRAILRPEGEELEATVDGDRLSFTLPVLTAHQIVELRA